MSLALSKIAAVLATKARKSLALLSGLLLLGCEPKAVEPVDLEPVYLTQAAAFRQSGQYESSIAEAEKALYQNPNSAAARLHTALALKDTGRARQGLKLIKQLPWREQSSAYQLTAIDLLTTLGYYSEPLAALGKLAASKTSHKNQLLLARATANSGNFRGALEALASLQPQYAAKGEQRLLWLEWLRLSIVNGEHEQALTSIDSALLDQPNDSVLLALRAECLQVQQQWPEAERILTEALAELPNTDILNREKVTVLNALSHVLVYSNRSHEAIIYDQLIAKHWPDYFDQQKVLDRVQELILQDKRSEAELILQGMSGEPPARTDVYSLLTKVHWLRGELYEASRYLNR